MTNQEIIEYTIKKTNELINAPSCYEGLKKVAQNWLDSAGKENYAEVTKNYIAELEADITSIDDLISLAESDMGVQSFGEEGAKNMAAHAKEIKAAGGKYCDCPACVAAAAILENKEALLQ